MSALPHRKQVEDDLKAGIAQAMRDNPNLTPDAALTKVAGELLKDNPFVPPSEGCPINVLPNEILAHIFYLGVKMDAEGLSVLDEDDDDFGEFVADEDEDDADDSDADHEMDIDDDGHDHDGHCCDMDHGSDGSWDSDDDPYEPPFQMLVSHVCSRWRAVALNEPSLWTTIKFDPDYSLDTAKYYIERSKGLPLDIFIDASFEEGDAETLYEVDPDTMAVGTAAVTPAPVQESEPTETNEEGAEGAEGFMVTDDCLSKDDVATILDLIIPEAHRWRLLEVQTSHYETMFLTLTRLKELPSAPLLEALQLLQRDDEIDNLETGVFSTPEYLEPMLLFHGNAPKLNAIGLWGVHIDWEASLSFLSGLRDVELAYHYNDVRPTYSAFAAMIKASPDLETLSLCGSGPCVDKETWDSEPAISIPSLQDLVLGQHDLDYIVEFFPHLHLPNLRSLVLDFDSADYTELIETLVQPHNKEKKSLLQGLEHIKISGLPCNKPAVQKFLQDLGNLKTLNINCVSDDEMQIFDALVASVKGEAVFCPGLETLTTRGVESQYVRAFLDARKKAGKPIPRLGMCRHDEIASKDQRWFDANLDEFELFDPSDSEEEMVEISDEDEDEDM